jgi:hypothetical protein
MSSSRFKRFWQIRAQAMAVLHAEVTSFQLALRRADRGERIGA